MINMIARIMEGQGVDEESLSDLEKKAFRDQNKIGWEHFARGRLSREWSNIRKIDTGKKNAPASEWRSKLSLILLTWLDKKWRMRCQMSEAQTGNREHEDLLQRCRKIWSGRGETVLLQGDRFLLREQYSPEEYHTADYLRAWIRTRELAKQAYGRARGEEGQPTLHRWLVRKDSYRDG